MLWATARAPWFEGRRVEGLAAEDADDGVTALDVDARQVVEAGRLAVVDRDLFGAAGRLDDLAERGEGLGGQGLGRDLAHQGSTLAPALIHAPRPARSASVMPVSLLSGMEWVVTART